MKLSEKKKTQLYNSVSNEVLDARIAIAKILNGDKNGEKINLVLYTLQLNAPQKAINIFNK